MLGPLSSYIFGNQLFRFDMWKEDWKTSNHFHSFYTLMIKHYNLSIPKWYCCVFISYVISNMSGLNLYGYNSKKIDTTYHNIDILFNLEQIPRSSEKALGHLVVPWGEKWGLRENEGDRFFLMRWLYSLAGDEWINSTVMDRVPSWQTKSTQYVIKLTEGAHSISDTFICGKSETKQFPPTFISGRIKHTKPRIVRLITRS